MEVGNCVPGDGSVTTKEMGVLQRRSVNVHISNV